jgi:hypothetical protein
VGDEEVSTIVDIQNLEELIAREEGHIDRGR